MDLRVNYTETINTGGQVTSKGSEFSELLNKINAVNEELKGYWEGQDASKYTSAIEQQAVTMKKLNETVNDIGSFLVKVGNAYKDTAEDNAGRVNI